MTSVDEIFSSAPRRHTCPLCDKLRAFQVVVQIRELDEAGQSGKKGARTKTNAAGFCADHAAEVFTLLVGEFSKAKS